MTQPAMTDALGETLQCFDPGRPLGTTEVADRLDLGRRATYERLERLVDLEHLETKAVGANARVWWRPPTRSRELGRREWGDGTLQADAPGNEAGFLALDADWRITDADERAAEILDSSIEELTGSLVWGTVTDLATPPAREHLEDAAAAQ